MVQIHQNVEEYGKKPHLDSVPLTHHLEHDGKTQKLKTQSSQMKNKTKQKSTRVKRIHDFYL